MKTLDFEIKINTNKEKVWDTMLSHGTYEVWCGAAFPNSTFEGTWDKGEKIKFFGSDGSGTVVEITDLKYAEFVLAVHIINLGKDGVMDTESEIAKKWIGTTENYFFTEDAGVTTLKVKMSIGEGWSKMFEDAYPKMLAKLKEICESPKG
jgi:uncharacterized protein YndB with AHSA1/START domain